LRYMFGWPGLVIIAIMATMINFLLNPAGAMLPLLVTKHFGGGAMQFAGLESIMGVGVIVGGVLLSIWGGFRRRIVTSMVGLLGIGLGSILVGLTPASAYLMAVVGMFVLGFALPITNGPLLAAVQAAVAPEMQGRVFTLINSAASAMTPLGLIIAAPVVDRLGVQSWYIMGGIISIVMAVVGCFIPAVMNLEEGRGQGNEIVNDSAVDTTMTPAAVDGD
jgi:DHA3 family macrolide efflux protein-like MFS transporter